jgi:hypothetical protein
MRCGSMNCVSPSMNGVRSVWPSASPTLTIPSAPEALMDRGGAMTPPVSFQLPRSVGHERRVPVGPNDRGGSRCRFATIGTRERDLGPVDVGASMACRCRCRVLRNVCDDLPGVRWGRVGRSRIGVCPVEVSPAVARGRRRGSDGGLDGVGVRDLRHQQGDRSGTRVEIGAAHVTPSRRTGP